MKAVIIDCQGVTVSSYVGLSYFRTRKKKVTNIEQKKGINALYVTHSQRPKT